MALWPGEHADPEDRAQIVEASGDDEFGNSQQPADGTAGDTTLSAPSAGTQDDARDQIASVLEELKTLNPYMDVDQLQFEVQAGRIVQLTSEPTELIDLSPLRVLTDLRVLNLVLVHEKLIDLEPIRDLRKLRHLCLQGTAINDLSPIEGMKLDHLNIWGWGGGGFDRGSDLSPIRGMPLTYLNCGWSSLTDLSPLEGMPLETLCLNHTKVRDLSPLRGLPIHELLIEGTPVTDLRPLEGMPLERLALGGTQASDLSVLKKLPLNSLFVDYRAELHRGLLDEIPTLQTINGKPIEVFRTESGD